MPRHFADDLIRRQRELGHPLCVGLDPHLERIPPLFRRGSMDPTDPRTPAAVGAFLFAILDRLGRQVVVVKPQTYMNRSGTALGPLLNDAAFDPSTDLLVLVDEVALPVGSFRPSTETSPARKVSPGSVAKSAFRSQ